MNLSRLLGLLSMVVLLSLVLPESAMGGGSPRAHDGGFFLRMAAGGGVASTSVEENGVELELSGTGVDLDIAIGAIVAENLALHGTLFGWLVEDPDIEIGGVSGETQNLDLDLSGVGGGLTYYFMPANVYLSGTVGLASLTVDTPAGDAETDAGVAVIFSLGKEWWVGNSWGLGAAAGVNIHSIPDGNIDERWTGTSFCVRFSATLN